MYKYSDPVRDAEAYYSDGEENERYHTCTGCGAHIYEGDPEWHINGEVLCQECAEAEYRILADCSYEEG